MKFMICLNTIFSSLSVFASEKEVRILSNSVEFSVNKDVKKVTGDGALVS